ncbi:D-alanyl-D-alanine carboxypeptidase/D-alanyl-D-alanine endopeptidase [Pengzhenrongella frigida]|uniref:D-alanyl-D-alanine carboxypeptidase/D-alanyl-D-alanine-endopeptidase n=1 Tax=Pengzhenrongella frigida TaxID=1259133 RepID=A0A4Q5MWL7_9MICO|nr:D-alanyl-D-alanine carboxypeptidase/D-alanyl-D-alanine-endopeptidase [Cellulomonas sp. HLT2-17]RYV49980.1 D-alanyl-D-alanine carboxypeptidase/D-alanyl-D-alanine-endopeptidase [Cellulomonas sp. HLT2-17]
MSAAMRVLGVGALVVVLTTGAYATADAYDVVPGLVTLAPVPPAPEPFATAPGAVAAVDPGGVLPALDADAPVPAAAAVTALLDALAADPRLGPSAGIVVADQLTGEILAQHDLATPHTPASTAKLVTAVAALSALGADQTVQTRVVRGGDGQIVLVGGGDMMLAAGAGDPAKVNGRAGLADLARQAARELTLAGTTTVTLAVDDTLFSGPALSPAWDPSHLTNGFTAPVTALAVDVAALRTDVDYPPRQSDPSLSAGSAFATALAAEGITVTGSPVRGTADAGALQLGAVESAPIGEVVDYFLESSDNVITEVVGRLVAIDAGLPGSFDGATDAVLARVHQLGVDTTGARLVDASGLADGSALPAQTLLGLLTLITDPKHTELRPVAVGMPIAGLRGTLSGRFSSSAARGLVRAKTGSLSGVTSLAGTVIDADGRQLLFVVVADQTPAGGQGAPRVAIDAFVESLAGCGCG